MESAIDNLEQSVKKADSRLDDISWKLDLFDQEVAAAAVTNGTKVSVMNLLDSVTQVKEDYEHLKREISEVQELQRVVRNSLHLKAMQVHQRMNALRSRINSAKSLPQNSSV